MQHGLYCIGCCWALMALLFVGGVMNLLWIAALMVFVLLEKLVPGYRYIARAVVPWRWHGGCGCCIEIVLTKSTLCQRVDSHEHLPEDAAAALAAVENADRRMGRCAATATWRPTCCCGARCGSWPISSRTAGRRAAPRPGSPES